MKNRFIYPIIVVFISCMINCTFVEKSASAASASISVKTENDKVVKGDTLYVIITVKSSEIIGGFQGCFSYDSSILKYVTGGSVMSGNDNEFYLTDLDKETQTNKIKYSVQFETRQTGSVSISLKKPYAVYSSDNSSEMSVASNSLNITVVNKAEMYSKGGKTDNEDGKAHINSSTHGTATDDTTAGDAVNADNKSDKNGSVVTDIQTDTESGDGKNNLRESSLNDLPESSSSENVELSEEEAVAGKVSDKSDEKNNYRAGIAKYIAVGVIIVLTAVIIIIILLKPDKKDNDDIMAEEEDDISEQLPKGSNWNRHT